MIVGIIQCAKTKKTGPCAAATMYWDSYIFRTNFMILEKICQKVYILSDKYGLITPNTIIAPYEADPKLLTEEDINLIILSALDKLPVETTEIWIACMPSFLRKKLRELLSDVILINNPFESTSLYQMHSRLAELKKQYLGG